VVGACVLNRCEGIPHCGYGPTGSSVRDDAACRAGRPPLREIAGAMGGLSGGPLLAPLYMQIASQEACHAQDCLGLQGGLYATVSR
jgi:hypothetical protein